MVMPAALMFAHVPAPVPVTYMRLSTGVCWMYQRSSVFKGQQDDHLVRRVTGVHRRDRINAPSCKRQLAPYESDRLIGIAIWRH
jgi:hypothetical protein